MKVWEVSGRDINLKQDTGRFNPKLFDRVAAMNAEIRRVFDEEWRDNIVFWDPTSLCTSTVAEEWQCGTFGPQERVCQRVKNHTGRCSDFFSPEDKKVLTKRLAVRRREELGEILGRRLHSTSQIYSAEKLKNILRDEERN